MPLIPNAPERALFLTFNLGPGPLLDLFSAAGFRTVVAGVRLGLFDALQAGPLRPADLAGRLKTDVRGTAVLLEALRALRYVRLKDGAYANTAMTAKWLVRASPDSVAAGFDFWHMALSEHWHNLEESIRTGRPPVDFYAWVEQHPQASRDFQAWMVALARIVAPEVVARVKLPGQARRLLDVGGGHGRYALAFCRRYPALSAVVFDAPQALEAARAGIAEAGLGKRMTTQAGNFLQDDLGSGYDVALLFNVVHGFTPEQNAGLLRRAAAALNPGGLVVVAEQVSSRAPGPASSAVAQILGMSYFHLLGGRIYEPSDIGGWMNAAGFARVRRIDLVKTPGNSLFVGTKGDKAR